MKTTYTPGPWIFAYGSVYRADTLNDENSTRIALMDRNDPTTMPTERDANARLIAAAPELLEACKSLEEIATLINARQHANAPLRAEDWSELFYSCGKARAAISKAEGN